MEMMKQYSIRNRTVGTVKKSTAAICLTWFLRKVLHVCEGGFFGVIMYFATVESAASYPNSFNSDWILGAPQVGFSLDIWRIRSRISLLIFSRPTLWDCDFQRQYSLKPWRYHLMTVSGFTMIRFDFQSGHIWESQDQNILSLVLEFGSFDCSLLNSQLLAKSQTLQYLITSADKQATKQKKITLQMYMNPCE